MIVGLRTNAIVQRMLELVDAAKLERLAWTAVIVRSVVKTVAPLLTPISKNQRPLRRTVSHHPTQAWFMALALFMMASDLCQPRQKSIFQALVTKNI